jgi:hypothetical protein
MHRTALSSTSKALPAITKAPRRHYASSFGLKKSKSQPKPRDDGEDALRVTDRLMNAAANAEQKWPGWERENPRDAHKDLLRRAAGAARPRPGRGGKEPRLEDLDRREQRHDMAATKKLPPAPTAQLGDVVMNMEELQVREAPGFSDTMEEDMALGGEEKLVPGTYVEIRRYALSEDVPLVVLTCVMSETARWARASSCRRLWWTTESSSRPSRARARCGTTRPRTCSS